MILCLDSKTLLTRSGKISYISSSGPRNVGESAVVDSYKVQAETNYWQSRITLHGDIRLQSDLQISNTPGKVSHCHFASQIKIQPLI